MKLRKYVMTYVMMYHHFGLLQVLLATSFDRFVDVTARITCMIFFYLNAIYFGRLRIVLVRIASVTQLQ